MFSKNIGGGGWIRTNDLRIMRTEQGVAAFCKRSTLFDFSITCKFRRVVRFVFNMMGSDPPIISISLQCRIIDVELHHSYERYERKH
jgi:hypothetical protein